jgi:riboflavin synthase
VFTGIIEELGTVKNIQKRKESFKFEIGCQKVLRGQKIGSSVSVNGCCLTIIKKNTKSFHVDLSEETLKKTNLGTLNIGDKVNLETSLVVSSLFKNTNSQIGGHLVLGHVDAKGKILKIKKLPKSHLVEIKFPKQFSKFLIHVGSVAIDGISMTVAEIKKDSFIVSVIPHTWKVTVFHLKKENDNVNLEFDMIGKYVERILKNKK